MSNIRAQISHDPAELAVLHAKYPQEVLRNPACPISLMQANPILTNPGLPLHLAKAALERHEQDGTLEALPFEEIEARLFSEEDLLWLLNHERAAVRTGALKLKGLDFDEFEYGALKDMPRDESWFEAALKVPTIPPTVIEQAIEQKTALGHAVAHPRTTSAHLQQFSSADIREHCEVFANARFLEIQEVLLQHSPLALSKNPRLHESLALQLMKHEDSKTRAAILQNLAANNRDADLLQRLRAYPTLWSILARNDHLPKDQQLELCQTKEWGSYVPPKCPSDLLVKILEKTEGWESVEDKEWVAASAKHAPLELLENIAQTGEDEFARELAQVRLDNYKLTKDPSYGVSPEDLEAGWRNGRFSTWVVLRASSAATPELLQEIALQSYASWPSVLDHPNTSMELRSALRALNVRLPLRGGEATTGKEALGRVSALHPFVTSEDRRKIRQQLDVTEMDPYLLRQTYYICLGNDLLVSDIVEAPQCPRDVLVHAFMNPLEKGNAHVVASGRLGNVNDGSEVPYVTDPKVLRQWTSRYPVRVAQNLYTDSQGLSLALQNAGEHKRSVYRAIAIHGNADSALLNDLFRTLEEEDVVDSLGIQTLILRNRNVDVRLIESCATRKDLLKAAMRNGKAPLEFEGRGAKEQKLAMGLRVAAVATAHLDSKVKERKQHLMQLSAHEIVDGVLKGTITSLEACCLPNTPVLMLVGRPENENRAVAMFRNPNLPDFYRAELLKHHPDLEDLPEDVDGWDALAEMLPTFGGLTQHEQLEQECWSGPHVGPAVIASMQNMSDDVLLKILEKAESIPEAFLDYCEAHKTEEVAALARVRKGIPIIGDPIHLSHDPELLRAWFKKKPTMVLGAAHCPEDLIESNIGYILNDHYLRQALIRARRALKPPLFERLLERSERLDRRTLTFRPDFPPHLWEKLEVVDCHYSSEFMLSVEKLQKYGRGSVSEWARLKLDYAVPVSPPEPTPVEEPEPPREAVVDDQGAWQTILSSALSTLAERATGSKTATSKLLSSAATDAVVGAGATQVVADSLVSDAVSEGIEKAMK